MRYFYILLTYLLTHSMVQTPSWEANWFAASKEIPRFFMEPEGSLPHSQASATCPCPGPAFLYKFIYINYVIIINMYINYIIIMNLYTKII